MLNYIGITAYGPRILYNIVATAQQCRLIEYRLFARPFSSRNDAKIKISRNKQKQESVTEPVIFQLSPSSQTSINQLLQKYPVNESNIRRLNGIKQIPLNSAVNSSTSKVSYVPIAPKDGGPHIKTRQQLPIYQFQQEILSLINNNQVIVLSGETG